MIKKRTLSHGSGLVNDFSEMTSISWLLSKMSKYKDITKAFLFFLFLNFAHNLPLENYKKEKEFLNNAGFGHLVDIFQVEEVEINHIPTLDNATLSQLGISTIGARCRIRLAARDWEEPLETLEETLVE